MFSSAAKTFFTPILVAVTGISIIRPWAPRGETAVGRQRDSW
jgi:hypothetical protein